MVERPLSMREVRGSKPRISKISFLPFFAIFFACFERTKILAFCRFVLCKYERKDDDERGGDQNGLLTIAPNILRAFAFAIRSTSWWLSCLAWLMTAMI